MNGSKVNNHLAPTGKNRRLSTCESPRRNADRVNLAGVYREISRCVGHFILEARLVFNHGGECCKERQWDIESIGEHATVAPDLGVVFEKRTTW